MPLGPSSKPVKSGGWITWSDSAQLIYAAKGNKTSDFYSFSYPDTAWNTLAPIPVGQDGELPNKGCRGVSDGRSRVYLTIGSNTRGFSCYDAVDDTWVELDKLPPQPSGRFARAGADMVFVRRNDTGYVYLLKGTTTDFCRFNTVAGRWTVLGSAPAGAKAKYAEGSWLVFDGDHTIYCHKAKVHELWRYDVAADRWLDTVLPGMPLVGMMARSRKSKDGGCAAFLNGRILALKGGNTQEFWCFYPGARTWTERETMPAFGSTLRRKRVKAGADITATSVGVLFALKGNKTCELWRYYDYVSDLDTRPEPPRSQTRAAGHQTGAHAGGLHDGECAMTVRDIAGRLVCRSERLPVGLRPGVYFIRRESGGPARKLVLVR